MKAYIKNSVWIGGVLAVFIYLLCTVTWPEESSDMLLFMALLIWGGCVLWGIVLWYLIGSKKEEKRQELARLARDKRREEMSQRFLKNPHIQKVVSQMSAYIYRSMLNAQTPNYERNVFVAAEACVSETGITYSGGQLNFTHERVPLLASTFERVTMAKAIGEAVKREAEEKFAAVYPDTPVYITVFSSENEKRNCSEVCVECSRRNEKFQEETPW